MKKINLITLFIFLLSNILYIGCDQNEEPKLADNNILPETFSVDIPNALSQNASTMKSAIGLDTLSGNEIYQHLTSFIRAGEKGAEIVEHIIDALYTYDINKPMVLTYESDDDGEVKNLVVVENSEFEGITWDYQITITDADSENNDNGDVDDEGDYNGEDNDSTYNHDGDVDDEGGYNGEDNDSTYNHDGDVDDEDDHNGEDNDSTSNHDGGIGIQIFWNLSPVKGIAIIKPFNLDRVHDGNQDNAMFRIDYSEAGEFGYDAHMIISATNLPVPPAFIDPYGMKTMKMFVGKKGDIIDVFGNSDHPNAYFFSDQMGNGFNWAFVAAGNDGKDIGVAEVGLPRNDIDESSRTVLLEEYSIKNVFTQAIYEWNPDLPSELVNAYLANTEAPGYFDSYGFVAAGERPDEDYAELDVRLPDMSPYNPKEIRNLTISFKAD